jgi:hypothetical protein
MVTSTRGAPPSESLASVTRRITRSFSCLMPPETGALYATRDGKCSNNDFRASGQRDSPCGPACKRFSSEDLRSKSTHFEAPLDPWPTYREHYLWPFPQKDAPGSHKCDYRTDDRP